jgi:regulator of sigma E protease
MTLIIFLIILGLIVFIHELGHFIFAKKNGIYVYEFSLGFGPKLFSFKRKNDPTEYMIKLIPLGGYVAMAGEEDIEEDNKIPDDEKLCNKSLWARFWVMIAGAMNNFILGIVLLFIMGLIYGTATASTTLSDIPKTGALYKAGGRNGEVITKIDGHKISNYDDVQTRLAIAGEGNAISITLKNKENEETTYNVTPEKEEDGNYYYGISVKVKTEKGFLNALKYAKDKFISIYKSMFVVIGSLFTGKLGVDSLSGPVGIYSVVDTVKSSFETLLYLTAYLSINIGFMNLIPFPAFDGGRVLFLLIEKIKGSKINPKIENAINNVGFILLMILMIFVTIKDIFNLV